MQVKLDLTPERVIFMLQQALSKEKEEWNPLLYKTQTQESEDITAEERDQIVQWLAELNYQLQLTPETFFLSIAILDTFFGLVKVKSKYLKCIAISCLFLGMKICEEDEVVVMAEDLIEVSRCGIKVADLVRMERIIVSKLLWDLKKVTALDFLQVFHAFLMFMCPGLLIGQYATGSGGLLCLLTRKLQISLANHRILQFKASTIALSLISLELEGSLPDWFAITVALQTFSEVEKMEIIRCRELLTQILTPLYCHDHFVGIRQSQPAKCKMEQADVEEIYDSIKHLYGDEGMFFIGAVREQ
ncbi:cyclin-I-like isoform X1 [Tachypleus tridentatus]|uniref:cyclin-I-like isoform X1 n=1 Tax=Tachypleus tridentatus TaxID=6853 RepID=UPI003FD1347E